MLQQTLQTAGHEVRVHTIIFMQSSQLQLTHTLSVQLFLYMFVPFFNERMYQLDCVSY